MSTPADGWQDAIRAAADEAFRLNPGTPPDPETLARIGRVLYPARQGKTQAA